VDRAVSKPRHAQVEEAVGSRGLCGRRQDQVSDEFDECTEGAVEGDSMRGEEYGRCEKGGMYVFRMGLAASGSAFLGFSSRDDFFLKGFVSHTCMDDRRAEKCEEGRITKVWRNERLWMQTIE
jgi:hypothetical protein